MLAGWSFAAGGDDDGGADVVHRGLLLQHGGTQRRQHIRSSSTFDMQASAGLMSETGRDRVVPNIDRLKLEKKL